MREENQELKPVVAKLNFEVDAKFLNFSGKLWEVRCLFEWQTGGGRTLYHVNMAKEDVGDINGAFANVLCGDETGERQRDPV